MEAALAQPGPLSPFICSLNSHYIYLPLENEVYVSPFHFIIIYSRPCIFICISIFFLLYIFSKTKRKKEKEKENRVKWACGGGDAAL